MKIKGPLVIDVSKWDDHLNIQELIDGGVVSVIVGLSGGATLNDNCKRICDQVAASKLVLQGYQYVYPQNDVYAQADWLAQIVHTTGYPFKFLWADCEVTDSGMAPNVISEKYKMFVERLNSRYSSKVGIYTNANYIKGSAPNMTNWISEYPAWIPHWKKQPTIKTMMSWTDLKTYWLPDYDFIQDPNQKIVVGHQFTGDKCLLPGVYNKYDYLPWIANKGRLPLDVSVFTIEFLRTLGAVVAPPPVPPPAGPIDYIVNVNAINVRSTPSTDLPRVGFLLKGTVVHLKSITTTNGYVQMTDGNWVFFIYLVKKV